MKQKLHSLNKTRLQGSTLNPISLTMFLLVSTLPISTSYAIDYTYIGPSGGDWSDPANWTPAGISVSYVNPGDRYIIPVGSSVLIDKITIQVEGTIDIQGIVSFNPSGLIWFLILNKGKVNINADGHVYVNSDGFLIIYPGGNLYINPGGFLTNNSSVISIEDGGIVSNSSTINNNAGGVIKNYGIINNNLGGVINNNSRGVIDNNGTITNDGGATITNNFGGNITNDNWFDNNGIIYNHYTITTVATFNNNGDFINYIGGTLVNKYSGKYVNYDMGSITNNFGATIINNLSCDMENRGTIDNNGHIQNKGMFSNLAKINNYETIVNSTNGAISNKFGGTITNYEGGTINVDFKSTIDNQGNIQNSGTITNYPGGLIINTHSIANNLSGAFNNNGTVNNNLDGIINNEGTFINWLDGIFTNNLGGYINHLNIIFNMRGSTFNNNGSMDVSGTIKNFGVFNNLTDGSINSMAGSVINNRGDFDNQGYLLIRGTLENGELSNLTGTNFILEGLFINNGNYIHNNSTVTVTGSGIATIELNTPTTFFNITVDSGATLHESVSTDNGFVTGTITNNGTIRKTKTISGPGTHTFGLTGISMDILVPGALTQIVVDRVDNNHPMAWGPLLTNRYWSIMPNTTGYTVNLTLPHNIVPETRAYLARHEGWGVWSLGRTSSTTSTVTLNYVTQLSDWTISDGYLPTSTATATRIPTSTPTPTGTWYSPTPTMTATSTPTFTFTPTPTNSSTPTLTSTITITPTGTWFSPTPLDTATPTHTLTFSPTATPSSTPNKPLSYVTFDRENYCTTSNKAIITVFDTDINDNPYTRQTVVVRITSDSDSIGINFTLTETTNDSSYFTSTASGQDLSFSTDGSSELFGLIKVSNGDMVKVSYTDMFPPVTRTDNLTWWLNEVSCYTPTPAPVPSSANLTNLLLLLILGFLPILFLTYKI